MKRTRIMLLAGTASLLAVAALSSNPLPEDTMYAVRTMLRVAQKPFQDNLTWDYEVIEPEYNLPEVFFGIRLKGDWPVERRKAALDAYLAVMADTDFTDDTNNDRDLPFKATAQCVSMNYTNALPYMRRLVLNQTLPEWKRRDEIGRLIRFSPVSDETTATMDVSRPLAMKPQPQWRLYSRTALTSRGKTERNALNMRQRLLPQASQILSRKVSVTGRPVFSRTMRQSGSCTVSMICFGGSITQDMR